MLDDDEEHSPFHYEFESPTFLGSHWLIDKDQHHHLFSLENHKYLENTSIKDPEGSFQYDVRMRKLTSLAGAMIDRPGKVCYLEFNVTEVYIYIYIYIFILYTLYFQYCYYLYYNIIYRLLVFLLHMIVTHSIVIVMEVPQ